MVDDGFPPLEQIIASAAKFLIEGEEYSAASALLACQPESFTEVDSAWSGNETVTGLGFTMRGPRVAHDLLKDRDSPICEAMYNAVNAVLPTNYYVRYINVRGELVPLSPGWKEELINLARGRTITNQGVPYEGESPRIWKGLRFRSATEVKIADALDHAGVFFLPNCLGRLNGEDGMRRNREADFLVCHQGHWGIIEIDGEPYHPAARAAEDHKRDRLFRQHGIKTVERFPATECYEAPGLIVQRFLEILDRAYRL